MDGEHAMAEAALSCQGFFKLVELGVPFPYDRTGEYVGYKTDHDPNNRGTSVGPYTSRYMTEALERSVRQRNVSIYDHCQLIRILTLKGRLYGILCLNREKGEFYLIRCANLICATGGPAYLYGDSVYPVSQMGASGLFFAAGVMGKNLTEWQYGLASLCPRWNVSGSYMQALPRFVSTDENGGDEREFLMEYYETREQMLNMVFLKGYQWPFDVQKAAGGSSMIDLLVYRETCVRGRKVWLDFRKNSDGKPVDFTALSKEASSYLKQAKAVGQTPYERLLQLNGPAVEFYRDHGVDLEREMLPVAVCAQHNNGGLSVDGWWQTNIPGIFAVGEAAGTHGICRPGGSALNSGQVGSTRAAQYIAAHKKEIPSWTKEEKHQIEEQVTEFLKKAFFHAPRLAFAKKWKGAVRNMSRYGAMLRDRDGMEKMKKEILEERKVLDRMPEKPCGKEAETAVLSRYFRYVDMRFCQLVYISAMLDYEKRGLKSRGSAVYVEKESSDPWNLVIIPELAAFRLDGTAGRGHADVVQEIAWEEGCGRCRASWRPVHPLSEIPDSQAFEVVWKAFREGKIYQ